MKEIENLTVESEGWIDDVVCLLREVTPYRPLPYIIIRTGEVRTCADRELVARLNSWGGVLVIEPGYKAMFGLRNPVLAALHAMKTYQDQPFPEALRQAWVHQLMPVEAAKDPVHWVFL